jgi:hypothetical protein
MDNAGGDVFESFDYMPSHQQGGLGFQSRGHFPSFRSNIYYHYPSLLQYQPLLSY